jgi:hypothetical protein
MENNLVSREPVAAPETQRRTPWVVSAGTVALGVAFALWISFRFRAPEAPPPEIIRSGPEVREVEKPAPLPQVIIQEVPEAEPEPPAAPPAPPPPRLASPPLLPAPPPVPSGWAGVWRQEKSPIPMFQLRDAGTSIAGTCVPMWGATLAFRDGKVLDDAVEFVVEDRVFRTHIRMTREAANRAKVEYWITDEDWLESYKRANKAIRTPQQALLWRVILEKNARLRGRPVTVGVFTRKPEAAEATGSLRTSTRASNR